MTTLAQTTQNINVERLDAENYRVSSFTKTDKNYDLTFNYDLRRWTCNCANYTIQKNPNCKHILFLRSYIKQASQTPAPEHNHSNSQELISILERISKLEQAQESADRESMLLTRDLEEHKALLDARAEQERLLRFQITQQQQQIDQLMQLTKQQTEIIEINRQNHHAVMMETSKIVEEQQKQIQMLAAALDQQGNMLQALALQAEMYKRMLDQISSQARPASEQIVRVVVEAPTRTSKREADEPKAMQIQEIRDEKGKLTSCKVGRFTVKIFGNSAGDCDCSMGLLGKQCPHIVAVDRHISGK